MLQAIRDRATGWIAWAIVILISMTFAFWGIGEYLTPDPNVTVAKVNGTEIGYQRYQQAYARQQARLRALLGAAYTPEMLDEEALRRQTLDALVRDEVLVQAGADDGMRIGDAQLAGAIQAQPTFEVDGRFSQLRYEGWLMSQGYSPGGFEFDLRRSMLTEQLSAGIGASEFATTREAQTMARLRAQERVLSTLDVTVEPASLDPVSEDEARSYFEANRDDFVAEEQLDVEYLLLARGDVAADIEVTEDALRALYEARLDTLGTPEQRDASHILITLASDADEGAVEEARGKIEGIRDRIVAGEAFEDLAREYSEDPGSASAGGALGGFSRGVMDPAFEEAAFALEVDVVSEPVRSAFGFHLIKVTAVQPGGAKPFEDVRGQLTVEYQAEQAEQVFYERMERLANLAFENPDSLDPAADALELEIQRSGLGARGSDDAVLGSAAVWNAALLPEVLEDGANSELLELDQDRVAVVRVVEHVRAARQSFETVRAEVEEAVLAARADDAARERGESLLEQLRAGAALETVAEEVGAEWSVEQPVTRDGFDPSPDVIEAAFRAARPADGAAEFAGVSRPGARYTLVAVTAVRDGADAGEDESRRAAATLSTDLGQRAFDAVVDSLRADASVELFSSELDTQ